MPENDQQQPNTDAEGLEPKDQSADPQGGQQADPNDALPEWARTKLSEANAQAASYRTKLREAEERLKSSKTVDEYVSATSALTDTIKGLERELLIRDVAAEYKLPKELAARLSGETKEELDADAKALAKFATPTPAGRTPGNPGGGLNPSNGSGFSTPEELKSVAKGVLHNR